MSLWSQLTHSFVLLRLPFSILLLPVFLLALSQAPCVDISSLLWSGAILHLLIYPSSNGYNSFIDRDTDSIGGLQSPPPVPALLGPLTLGLDLIAGGLALWLNIYFGLGCICLILLSRAYSAPWPRLKRLPVGSFILVATFQGAGAFGVSLLGMVPPATWDYLWRPHYALLALASSLLVGGSYPLSQIYQHEADHKRGDQTLSLLLGIQRTLVFSGIMFGLSGLIFATVLPIWQLLILGLCLGPAGIYFIYWSGLIRKSKLAANFSHTMRMNLLAALGAGLAFGLISLWTWSTCIS